MIEATKETWCEAEVHRIAGEIALMSPQPKLDEAAAFFHSAAPARSGTSGPLQSRANSAPNPGNSGLQQAWSDIV